MQTLVMVESITSVEQGFKVLDLIVRHLENRAGTDVNDCESVVTHVGRLGAFNPVL